VGSAIRKASRSNGGLTKKSIVINKFNRNGGFIMRLIADMVNERKQLVEKAEAILNEAEKAGGSLTKEQEREFNHYTDKIKSINDSIDEELLNIRTSEPILNTPHNPMARVDEGKAPMATKAV
jgi:hypothetical protein